MQKTSWPAGINIQAGRAINFFIFAGVTVAAALKTGAKGAGVAKALSDALRFNPQATAPLYQPLNPEKHPLVDSIRQ